MEALPFLFLILLWVIFAGNWIFLKMNPAYVREFEALSIKNMNDLSAKRYEVKVRAEYP